jgi:multiple sugar transport system permease protein
MIEEAKMNFKSGNVKPHKKRNVFPVICFILLLFYALAILIPFYIMLITALKTTKESMNPQFTWWPQQGFSLEGFRRVLVDDMAGGGGKGSTILRGFGNTMLIIIPRVAVWVFMSALAAFAYAKMRFKAKKVLYGILLSTMFVPGTVLMIPSFIMWDNLYLTDTFVPLILPACFGGPACVFFLRQFFTGIPDELLEAGKIDGMGEFRLFLNIMLPLSMPAVIAQIVLGFVNGYNEYLAPLMYLQSPERYTLQLALRYYTSTYANDYQAIMSGAFVALVPTILLYIAAQKFFIEGIAMSGLKG